jgi:hypothetical protein
VSALSTHPALELLLILLARGTARSDVLLARGTARSDVLLARGTARSDVLLARGTARSDTSSTAAFGAHGLLGLRELAPR